MKKAADDAEMQAELLHKIREAAIKGMDLIHSMITDPEISDASRLAAARYAIDRVVKDNHGPENRDATLGQLLEIVRQLRTPQPGPIPAATLPGEAVKPKDPSNYDQWIDSI
jgi:hypothetical protein